MLNFDYDKAMTHIQELRQIAEEMERMRSQKLDSVIEGVQSSWKGDAGKSILVKCEEFGLRIEKEIQNIHLLIDQLETEVS